MMITIGGEKGGGGKTTLAVHLAALCAVRGDDVLLVDADPQQSAARWVERRAEMHPDAPGVRCVTRTGKRIDRDLADLGRRYAVVIIDTGGRDSLEMRSALLVSDRIVLPVRPEQFDCWTLPTMARIVDEVGTFNQRLVVSVVLNQIPHQVRETAIKETMDWIEAECPTLPSKPLPIVGRAAFGRANAEGLAVTEMPKVDPKARTEIMAFFREVTNAH
jgi:chromosome partitioning protein